MPTVPVRPIRRLLVANRGEIACRIVRAAHALGITTVAVCAEPDRAARHVRLADEAVALVGGTVAETYLDIEQVVAAAVRAGADAVHPGYGFLAENPAFARAVVAAGLVWVGPDADTVEAMGSKLRAKQLAAEAGVPLPPSAPIVGDDPVEWRSAAATVGFPLLVKASAGGGGRGMRLVDDSDVLADAVRAARREAESAFGDPAVFLEAYLRGHRHVEVQVLGDQHGTVLHLGERECSVQRRHQKLIEEAPSAGISDDTRRRLHDSALALARSVGYVGPGTVEFLVSREADGDQRAYFLEMNTRLQVEHPVTEAVTGLDLVALQLRVAEGRPLGLSQEDVRIDGHAIEARLCAEDPVEDYLPSSGRLLRFDLAPEVRWDSGYDAGDVVPSGYDSLVAKAIAHAPTRDRAAAVLTRALRQTVVHGVRTNTALLAATLESAQFLDASTTTDFLERHREVERAQCPDDVRRCHEVAATAHARAVRRAADQVWGFAPAGWRNVATPATHDPKGRGAVVHDIRGDLVDLEVDGVRSTYVVTADGGDADETMPLTSWVSGRGWTSEIVVTPRFPVAVQAQVAGGSVAPVPGTVTAVLVEVGAQVSTGDTLIVLEAMKMEHRIGASGAGQVTAVHVRPGDAVDAHQPLVTLEVAPDE